MGLQCSLLATPQPRTLTKDFSLILLENTNQQRNSIFPVIIVQEVEPRGSGYQVIPLPLAAPQHWLPVNFLHLITYPCWPLTCNPPASASRVSGITILYHIPSYGVLNIMWIQVTKDIWMIVPSKPGIRGSSEPKSLTSSEKWMNVHVDAWEI